MTPSPSGRCQEALEVLAGRDLQSFDVHVRQPPQPEAA
jgi:hypothetical protein